MNLIKWVTNRPLPVFNAPAVNNAYQSMLSKPPTNFIEGAGGRLNRVAFSDAETPIPGPQSQGVVMSGYDGQGQPVWQTFGSQPLSDPKAKNS